MAFFIPGFLPPHHILVEVIRASMFPINWPLCLVTDFAGVSNCCVSKVPGGVFTMDQRGLYHHRLL